MKVIDLFCGTKSIANAFKEEGFEAITLDSEFKFSPDIWIDILEWDYSRIGYVDVIWASPPCQGFSVGSVYHHWKKEKGVLIPQSETALLGLRLIKKTLEIIKYIKPRYWFIENPRAMLRIQDFMFLLPRETITYCQYGEKRMKPTDIWGKFPADFPISKCKPGDSCHEKAPRGSKTGTQGLKGSIDRGRIPHEFCSLLARCIKNEIKHEK